MRDCPYLKMASTITEFRFLKAFTKPPEVTQDMVDVATKVVAVLIKNNYLHGNVEDRVNELLHVFCRRIAIYIQTVALHSDALVKNCQMDIETVQKYVTYCGFKHTFILTKDSCKIKPWTWK
jgi:hypothetical protein